MNTWNHLTMFPWDVDASGRHRASWDKSVNSLQSTSSAGSLNARHVLARAARSAVAFLPQTGGEQYTKISESISCISSA